MAALLKWDLSLTYSDSTVCLLTSRTKKTWTQNKKNCKNLGKFQAVFLNFYTLNGYKFYRKKLLDKTKKLGRVFYIINLSAFIDSCKCVDKRNDCQLNSGIKRCKTKIFLPICVYKNLLKKNVIHAWKKKSNKI